MPLELLLVFLMTATYAVAFFLFTLFAFCSKMHLLQVIKPCAKGLSTTTKTKYEEIPNLMISFVIRVLCRNRGVCEHIFCQ